jgi:hypothetical protein
MPRYIEDKQKQMHAIKKRLIQEHQELRPLEELTFIYTFVNGELIYREGQVVDGYVKKLSPHDRDRDERDVEICVHYDTWMEKKDLQKERLIYNLLLRVHILTNEQHEPQRDEDERIRFRLRKPSIRIAVFEEELEKYGLAPEDAVAFDIISKHRMARRAASRGFGDDTDVGYPTPQILH